jgi:hypothetical protein
MAKRKGVPSPQKSYQANAIAAQATLKHSTVAGPVSINRDWFFMMVNFLKLRLNRLTNLLSQFIEQLSQEEELEEALLILQPLYYDLYMLKAIRESQRTVRPGDSMTYEEAVRVLRSR